MTDGAVDGEAATVVVMIEPRDRNGDPEVHAKMTEERERAAAGPFKG